MVCLGTKKTPLGEPINATPSQGGRENYAKEKQKAKPKEVSHKILPSQNQKEKKNGFIHRGIGQASAAPAAEANINPTGRPKL